MPLLLGSSPWLKSYLIGALSDPPRIPSLNASYLQATTPVTSRRTLSCFDGAHTVSVVLSQSVASAIDADEEGTGVTTRNLLGYILAPVQVVVLTDMTSSPPSATLLVKQLRLFSDRTHQRPAAIPLSVDKDPDVVTALRANIGRQLAAFSGPPEKGRQSQSDAELVAVFETLEKECPPLPPRNLLVESDTFSLSGAQDEPLGNGIANGLPRANENEDDELLLDPKDLELLDPHPLPILDANTPSTTSPQSAANSHSRRAAREDSAASIPVPHGNSAEHGNADGRDELNEMHNSAGKSPPQGSAQSRARELFTEEERPLTQHFVFDDENVDCAHGASESSGDQDLGDLQLDAAFDLTLGNIDGDDERIQAEEVQESNKDSVAVVASQNVADRRKRAGDGQLQFAPKTANNQKKSAPSSSNSNTGRRNNKDLRKSAADPQPTDNTMAITRAARSTTKQVSSDKTQPEVDVEKQPGKDDEGAPFDKDTAPIVDKEKEGEQPMDLDKGQAAPGADTQDTGEPASEALAKDSKLGEAEGDEEHQPSSPRVKTQRPAEADIQTGSEPKEGDDQIKPSVSQKEAEKQQEKEPEKKPQEEADKPGPRPEDSQFAGTVDKRDENEGPNDNEQEVDKTKTTTLKDMEKEAVEEEQTNQKMDVPEVTEKVRPSKKRPSPPLSTAMNEDEIEAIEPTLLKSSTEGRKGRIGNPGKKSKRQRNGEDYHLQKIQAELQVLKDFRENVDRNTEMFILNPEHFLPGKMRRSVDRLRRESFPPPRISQISDLETDRAPR